MPIDYAFFDLDRYEQSISDEGKKEFRVRPLSDEDVARHPEAADGDVKSEKSAKSKKKHVHKWLRKQHKKRGSYEVDLLTKFGDTSRLNSDKSSSEAAFDEENDKFSKSDDSCSLSRSSFSFKDQHSLIEEEGNVLPKTIEDIRKETGTQVLLLSSKYVTGPRRVGDERLWNSRNLRCAHCLGKCPVCSIACCVYEEARRKMAKSSSDCDKAAAAELVQIIEGFGSKVKDMSTFSLCSILGGCGRRVCPDCSGICPTNICRDVQCKDCKPDPWEPCNWHDF
ncbi:hypothetical protein MAP00_006596 [Monascus purpureus]|nr:hypothetical protein MAP00_006596 [Monascus purpureus]